MQEFLYGFIKNLAVYSLLVAVVMNFLPNNQYQKYIKLFVGFILILIVMAPITKITRLDDKISKSFNFYNLQIKNQESSAQGMNDFKDEQILVEYEKQVKSQMKTFLNEAGHQVTDLEVEIADSKEEFGQIKSIQAAIKGEEKDSISIETITIGKKEQEQDTSLEALELKTLLKDFYNVEQDNINIKIQR